MYDKELVRDILNQILDATQKVISRSAPIKTADDFNDSPEGMEKACHREERSDEAIFKKLHFSRHPDCFASLAMTYWDFLRMTLECLREKFSNETNNVLQFVLIKN
ncbi:MAG: hypothetical protein GXO75_05315 [Calditrichaeota bacterium]|nr:hypothetical protein [Calditrichota bacterium]